MGAITRAGAVAISILLVAGAWAIRSEVAGSHHHEDQAHEVGAVRASDQVSPRGRADELVLVGIEAASDDGTTLPAGCELLAIGVADDTGAEPAFDAWFDAKVEDGTLDYIGRSAMRAEAGVWELTTWDGERRWLGWSVTEDGDVWSSARCAAAAIEAEAAGR